MQVAMTIAEPCLKQESDFENQTVDCALKISLKYSAEYVNEFIITL